MANFIDQNGVELFIDQNSVMLFEDQNGIFLGLIGSALVLFKKIFLLLQ